MTGGLLGTALAVLTLAVLGALMLRHQPPGATPASTRPAHGPGRHRDHAGRRAHRRQSRTVRPGSGFAVLLRATRVARQDEAFASYARNLTATGTHVRRLP